MRFSTKLLTACAVVALAGSAAWAAGQSSLHRLTVALPDGGAAQIVYSGDVVPRVVMMPATMPNDPVFAGFEQVDSQMNRMFAAMDREMDAAMRQAAAMAAMPSGNSEGLSDAVLRNLPAGGESYSLVSTMSGGKVCTREVRITSRGNGAKPELVSQTSGDCAGAPANIPVVPASNPDTPLAAQVIPVKARLPVYIGTARNRT